MFEMLEEMRHDGW